MIFKYYQYIYSKYIWFMSKEILLSILIASVPERINGLAALLQELSDQTFGKPVEILVITDNRHMTIGMKRQRLNELSQGKYVIHVDDDDMVSKDFVDSLLAHIHGEIYDCITFTCMVQGDDGRGPMPCYYGASFPYVNYPNCRLRQPNPRCCYRRSIAIRHAFQDVVYGEDDEWAMRASKDIQSEMRIPNVLYYYTYITKPEEWFTARGTIRVEIIEPSESSNPPPLEDSKEQGKEEDTDKRYKDRTCPT